MNTTALPAVINPLIRNSSDYLVEQKQGVWTVMPVALHTRVIRLEAALEQYRTSAGIQRISDPAAFGELPFGKATAGHPEWLVRREDLALVRQQLQEHPQQTILEIGAWNGWLSNQLSLDGHLVTALDYFGGALDGLHAMQNYSRRWVAIQTDLQDLSILTGQFNCILLNRCLAYLPDAASYLAQLLRLLKPEGIIIATGLAVFRRPAERAAVLWQRRKAFRDRYGCDMLLHPCKGFLDRGDEKRLQEAGFVFYPYRAGWLSRLRTHWQPSRPLSYYAILRNTRGSRPKYQ